METIKISAVIAVADNGAMGRGGNLPWYEIKEDFKRFYNLTAGKHIVMGRYTYESLKKRLGGNLPDRTSIVVSNSLMKASLEEANLDCIPVYSDERGVRQAIEYSLSNGQNEIVVIGGAKTLSLFSSYIDKIYLTIVHCSPKADVFFPVLDLWNFSQVKDIKRFNKDSDNQYSFSFIDLKRN